jgi:hypothetical protein
MRQMKRLIPVSLFVLAILFVNCSNEKWQGKIYKEQGATVIESEGPGLWGDKICEKVTFKENLSFGKETGEEYLVFHSELDLAVDSELNIYVLDIRNHRLLKFDNKGNFIWKAGRRGQGPGEFTNPEKVKISPSAEICVLDYPSHIRLFDNQGKYIRTIKLEGRCGDFYFLPDGRLLVSRTTRGQMGIAAEYYSIEGELLEKFPDEYRYGPKLPSWSGGGYGGGFRFLEGKIYMTLPDKYEIREYDFEGKLLGKIKRDFELKPPEVRMIRSDMGMMMASNVIGPCFLYKNKMFLNMLLLVKRKAEEEVEIHLFLDFFNEKGQFLGSYKLPEETKLYAIDHENYLYFVQKEPFPRVIRSTLNID